MDCLLVGNKSQNITKTKILSYLNIVGAANIYVYVYIKNI